MIVPSFFRFPTNLFVFSLLSLLQRSTTGTSTPRRVPHPTTGAYKLSRPESGCPKGHEGSTPSWAKLNRFCDLCGAFFNFQENTKAERAFGYSEQTRTQRQKRTNLVDQRVGGSIP